MPECIVGTRTQESKKHKRAFCFKVNAHEQEEKEVGQDRASPALHQVASCTFSHCTFDPLHLEVHVRLGTALFPPDQKALFNIGVCMFVIQCSGSVSFWSSRICIRIRW
jgi:hypothetical protein